MIYLLALTGSRLEWIL